MRTDFIIIIIILISRNTPLDPDFELYIIKLYYAIYRPDRTLAIYYFIVPIYI